MSYFLSGYFIEFWVCNKTYSYRIYSVGTSYYDKDGVLITIWDEYYDDPPKKVPTTIIIPLIEDVEEPTPAEEEAQWGLWVGVATLALVVLIGIILLLKSRKKKGLNK